MGNSIEAGSYQSTRSRAGIKWSKESQKKHKRLQKEIETQATRKKNTTSHEVTSEIIDELNTCVQRGFNRINNNIVAESPAEKEKSVVLLSSLFSYFCYLKYLFNLT